MLEPKPITMPHEHLATVGQRIRWIIQEKQVKQVEFAKSLGISANYVYLLTSGKKGSISKPLAQLIEIVYGYPAQWLLTGKVAENAKDSPWELLNDTIQRVKQMNVQDLRAVSTFIKSLETIKSNKNK